MIWTHDLCNTSAVLYQLSWTELVTLRVRNIPIECEECKWIYERSYIWPVVKDANLIDHHSYRQNLSSCEIKAWKKLRPERDWTHDLYDNSTVLYQQLVLFLCIRSKIMYLPFFFNNPLCLKLKCGSFSQFLTIKKFLKLIGDKLPWIEYWVMIILVSYLTI